MILYSNLKSDTVYRKLSGWKTLANNLFSLSFIFTVNIKDKRFHLCPDHFICIKLNILSVFI